MEPEKNKNLRNAAPALKHFTSGKYLGVNKRELSISGLILSETVYQEGYASDWHTHENAYFAFVMSGGCLEKRKKESVECLPGKMLFYNWEEPHRNHDYQPGSRIFNIEFNNSWLKDTVTATFANKGILNINDINQKFLLLKILKEYKSMDSCSILNIETMTAKLISSFNPEDKTKSALPQWAMRLHEILNDQWQENFSLNQLSQISGVHPVTISKYFSQYFGCNIGEYIRKTRIDRSLNLIRSGNNKLTDISYSCSFADQSHFIRSFKKVTGSTPKEYRNF
jgi:AraC family transcriptional regulator